MTKQITKKVLIIVDVQNCFLGQGTLGTGDNHDDTYELTREINDYIEKSKLDVIVCTKDLHPDEHSSFKIYGNHCRMSKHVPELDLTKCDQIGGNGISGPNLSYTFSGHKNTQHLFEPNVTIYHNMADGRGTGQVTDENIQICGKFESSTPMIVHLYKGQYSKFDANSAFQYDRDENSKLQPLNYNYSTGLLEFLIKYINKNNVDNLQIEICGLVGNICVAQTFIYGLLMLCYCGDNDVNKLNKNVNITLKYLFSDCTRFLSLDIGDRFVFSRKMSKDNVLLMHEYLKKKLNDVKNVATEKHTGGCKDKDDKKDKKYVECCKILQNATLDCLNGCISVAIPVSSKSPTPAPVISTIPLRPAPVSAPTPPSVPTPPSAPTPPLAPEQDGGNMRHATHQKKFVI